MSDAPKRLDLAEDPMGGWWSAADEPPEGRVAFTRSDIADGYREALMACVKALIERLHHDEYMTEDEYPYSVIAPSERALAKGDEGHGL